MNGNQSERDICNVGSKVKTTSGGELKREWEKVYDLEKAAEAIMGIV